MLSNMLINQMNIDSKYHNDGEKEAESTKMSAIINELQLLSCTLPNVEFMDEDIPPNELFHRYGEACQRSNCRVCEHMVKSLKETSKLYNFDKPPTIASKLDEISQAMAMHNIHADFPPLGESDTADEIRLRLITDQMSELAPFMNMPTDVLLPTRAKSGLNVESVDEGTLVHEGMLDSRLSVRKELKNRDKKPAKDKKATLPNKRDTKLATQCLPKHKKPVAPVTNAPKALTTRAPVKETIDARPSWKRMLLRSAPRLSGKRCNKEVIAEHLHPCKLNAMKQVDLTEEDIKGSCSEHTACNAHVISDTRVDRSRLYPSLSDVKLDCVGNANVTVVTKEKRKTVPIIRRKVTLAQVFTALTWFSLVRDSNTLPYFKHCNYTNPPNYFKLTNERECVLPQHIKPISYETYQIWGVGSHGAEIMGTHCIKKTRSRTCYDDVILRRYTTDDSIYTDGLSTSECEADSQGHLRYDFKPCFPRDSCGYCSEETNRCSWIERYHVKLFIMGDSIVAGGLRTTHCSPQSGLCTLNDKSILAWDPQMVPKCKYVPGPKYNFTKSGEFLLSESDSIALRMLPTSLLCGDVQLIDTAENFYLVKESDAKPPTEPLMGLELLSVNYVTYKTQVTSNEEFSKVWWEMCKVTNDNIRFINWMASTDPTAAINHILRKNNNVGVYGGLGIYYWSCSMVNDYSIMHTDNCTHDVPIEWQGLLKSISRSRLEIVDYNPAKCITDLPYALSDGNHTLVWDGKRYRFETVNNTKEMYAHIAPQTIWSVKINIKYLSAKVSDQMQTMSQLVADNSQQLATLSDMVISTSNVVGKIPILGDYWWWEVISHPALWILMQFIVVYIISRRNRRSAVEVRNHHDVELVPIRDASL